MPPAARPRRPAWYTTPVSTPAGIAQQQYTGALDADDRAIKLNPEVAAYHSNKGNAYLNLRRTGHALDAYGRALEVDPLEKDTRFNPAICRLLTDDLERGFRDYEWCWQTGDMAANAPARAQPRWHGHEPFNGKPVWILLSRVPDWRRLMEREDSPWYPSAAVPARRGRAVAAGACAG